MYFWDIALNTLKSIRIWSAFDILIVAIIFYKLYQLIEETRAEQLLKGIIFVFLLIPISSFFKLTMLNWILSNTLPIGFIAVVIIFQPEIRKALEHIGRTTLSEVHVIDSDELIEKALNEIANAAQDLSSSKTGALIVIEQTTGLNEIIDSGTKIDAIISSALLENIFVVNTPLHDGATIIRNGRIIASGCFLPLSDNNTISKKLGTRHRAALGISEVSDALTVVVSEETGTISLAVNGRLTSNYNKDKLKDVLTKIINSRRKRKTTWAERVGTWIRERKKN